MVSQGDLIIYSQPHHHRSDPLVADVTTAADY